MNYILAIYLASLIKDILHSTAVIDSLADFTCYYNAIVSILKGLNPYTIDSMFGYIYPPTSFLFIGLFGTVDYIVAKYLWILLSLVAFFVSQWILVTSLFKENRVFYFLIFTILGVNLFPFKHTLGMGQINLFILLISTLIYYSYINNKKTLAGLFLAVATAIKISPIILVIFFIRKREYKTIASFIISFVTLTVTAAIMFGWNISQYYWTTSFPGIQQGSDEYANQSLSAFMNRLMISNLHVSLVNSCLFLAATILTYILINKQKTSQNISLLEFSLPIELGLIFSGITWNHHLVIMLLPIMSLYRYCMHSNSSIKTRFFTGIATTIAYYLISILLDEPTKYAGITVIARSHALMGVILCTTLAAYILLKQSLRTVELRHRIV